MVTIPSKLNLIGDPHLGREFVQNVPLDRRGDREAYMLEDFVSRLIADPDKTTVIVGDLFERPIVSQHVLHQTIDAIITASLVNKIVIIAGNHDLDKATEKRGSFHLLALALQYVPNVDVVLRPEIIDDVVYFPWQYEFTAAEQVDAFADTKLPPVAVGHWDLESFGGDESHLCPAQLLKARGVETIISGHWHIAGDYVVDSVPVYCTGSMQPMTHAEDPDGNLYVTLTKEQYEEADPEDFINKYIRVRLAEGEEITPPTTCLGFKTEFTKQEKEIERVNMGTFDLNDILAQAFKSFEVTPNVQKLIKENLNDTN